MRRPLLLACCLLLLSPETGRADVVFDGSLGDAGPAPESTPGQFRIDESRGRRAGENLFWSFRELGIARQESATFSAIAPTRNLIARVTGGSTSLLFGTLSSQVPGAALFLINPSGIALSNTARVDVAGSLHLSTASELLFSDGSGWLTGETTGTLPSGVEPAAFGFRGGEGPVISRAAPLQTSPGTTLSLVGGEVELLRNRDAPQGRSSTRAASGGRVQIAAGGPGVAVPLDLASFDPASLAAPLGDVVLREADVRAEGGGSIVIRGGRIELEEAVVQLEDRGANVLDLAAQREIDLGVDASFASLVSRARDADPGGEIRVDAPYVRLGPGAVLLSTADGAATGGRIQVTGSTVEIRGGSILSSPASTGRGGDVEIRAGLLELAQTPDATSPRGIETRVERGGDGGDVRVQVGTLRIDGSAGDQPAVLRAIVAEGGSGKGGSIEVEAERVDLVDGGQLSTSTDGSGDAGSLAVRASALHVSGAAGPGVPSGIFANSGFGFGTTASGDGGAIEISADTVSVVDGADLAARSFGSGAAGRVTIEAREQLEVIGGANGAAVISTQAADGPGGELELHSPVIEIRDGGQVSASATGAGDARAITLVAERLRVEGSDPTFRNPSAIFAQALRDATGDAGDVVLSADQIELGAGARISVETQGLGDAGRVRIFDTGSLAQKGDAQISSTTGGSGRGGDIDIQTRREVVLEDGASIRAQSTLDAEGAGDAGNVRIDAGAKLDLHDSRITTESTAALGGNVEIRAHERVYLNRSELTTSVASGTGSGGNVSIDPRFVILNRSQLLARADAGNGGDIRIRTDEFLQSVDSRLDASSRLGLDGNILVSSPAVDLSADLANLPQTFLDASQLLQARCALRAGTSSASLFIRHRNGIPLSPDQPLPWHYRLASSELAPAPVAPGDYAGELAHFEAELAASESPARQSESRLELAQSLERLGNLERALDENARALAQAESAGGDLLLAAQLGLRARLLRRSGRPTEAREALDRAQQVVRDPRHAELGPHLALEQAALLRDTEPRASLEVREVAWRRARELARSQGASRLAAHASVELGRALRERADPGPASKLLLQTASSLWTDISSHASRLLLLRAAQLLEGLPANDPTRAARAAEIYAAVAQESEAARDLRSATFAWGYLGRAYARAGRDEEALALTRQALAAASEAGLPEARILWERDLGRLHARQGRLAPALRAYRRVHRTFQRLRSSALLANVNYASFTRQFDGPAMIGELVDLLLRTAERTDAPDRQRALLLEARARIDDGSAVELQEFYRDECLASLRRPAPETIPGTLVVYPVVLEDRTELLLSLPGGRMRAVRVDVTRDELTATVRELRDRLQQRTTNRYRPPARRLYRWLVEPLEEELEASAPEVVVIAAAGPLRTIPLGALLDPETGRFLAEKYPIAMTLGLSITEPRALARGELLTLKAGLSKPPDEYPALPHVLDEIQSVDPLFPGPVLLDDAFVKPELARRLRDEPFGVVHLASHAEFGGDLDSTFLLTHDGKLGMPELARMVSVTRLREQPLELLTLSACETAAGDDRSLLGLAGVAVKSGARSTLATLWQVNDRAASQLIRTFYEALAEPGVSRARALQRAQLALIQDRALRHPALWSPFVLIGSWL